MARHMVKGTPGMLEKDFTTAALIGTETVDAAVGAGEIGVIIGSSVDVKQSSIIDALISGINDVLRENQYS